MEDTAKRDESIRLPRLLVHICCGPCAVYPLKRLLSGSFEVWGYFNNPNIHPHSEFKKRLQAAKRLAELMSLDVIFEEAYSPGAFLKEVRSIASLKGRRFPRKADRCAYCYASRLEATARRASESGFDAFTSSLLYSTSQQHQLIGTIGSSLEREYGVRFHYEDFRRGWQEGIDRSKEAGLYRQKYCGCIYSRIERYSDRQEIERLHGKQDEEGP